MLNDETKLGPAPEATAFDYAVDSAKGLSVLFPPAASAVLFFDIITKPMRTKRMDEWCEDVRVLLNEHSAKFDELTPEKLVDNEAFQSAFLQAGQAAIKTHDGDKLIALQNAVLNAAIGRDSDDRQAIFLSLVDRLTPAHLRILAFFDQLKGNRSTLRMGQAIHETTSAIPELKNLGDKPIQLLIDDLNRAGLLNVTEHSPSQFIEAPNRRWTSDWGHDFLKFITSPTRSEAV